MITSSSNAAIKRLAKLKNKKDRDETGLFLVEGMHMIEEAAKAHVLLQIYALEDHPDSLPLEPVLCSQQVLNKLSSQKSDAKIIGVCKEAVQPDLLENSSFQKFLLLDHIQDPGNVGSLIRSAYAFGVQAVLLSRDCADLYNPKTLQSTQGALFHLPCIKTDLDAAVRTLKKRGIPVFGAALHHDSLQLHTLQVPASFGVLIGNEGAGIREDLLCKCSHTLFIEMQDFESLNAAIAGSIILYHFQFPEQANSLCLSVKSRF